MAFLLHCLRAVRTMSGQLDLLPPLAAVNSRADVEMACAVPGCGRRRVGRGEHRPSTRLLVENLESFTTVSPREPVEEYRQPGSPTRMGCG